jgi:hypothetical protein
MEYINCTELVHFLWYGTILANDLLVYLIFGERKRNVGHIEKYLSSRLSSISDKLKCQKLNPDS